MEENKCRTFLLSDEPAEHDSFGAHEKVANAIAELIANEEGGKTIGLEGGWGSGKSTIVNLIRKKLVTGKNHCLILFDAWAHQGDPLRRTFLESLVLGIFAKQNDTDEQIWIDEKEWNNILDELAKRRKVTDVNRYPLLKPWGKWLVGSSLLVPLGMALLNSGLRKNLSLFNSGSLAWDFILGVLFSIAPILILLAITLLQIGKHKTNGENDPWAMLFFKSIADTRTETIEEPNPTSVEFEKIFSDLMGAALTDENRKFAVILDNLDRIDGSDALSILSTLQTFFQHRQHQELKWLERLWVIIPYDRDSLQRLWKNDDDGSPLSVSFLDKRFQIRFEVPPLVLSNWSEYLRSLLIEAFPDHDKAEFHTTYRVYDQYLVNIGESPTPRDLKIFVN
ncbi:MAG: P-loop NTPase fold protein, partial [Chloroflexota bacterium]